MIGAERATEPAEQRCADFKVERSQRRTGHTAREQVRMITGAEDWLLTESSAPRCDWIQQRNIRMRKLCVRRTDPRVVKQNHQLTHHDSIKKPRREINVTIKMCY